MVWIRSNWNWGSADSAWTVQKAFPSFLGRYSVGSRLDEIEPREAYTGGLEWFLERRGWNFKRRTVASALRHEALFRL